MTKKKLIKHPPLVEPLKTSSKETNSSSQKVPKLKKHLKTYVKNTKKKYQPQYEKALRGKLSPRKAIAVKCKECVGFELVKENVGNCTCEHCPLHAYRPFQG
ncbi:MAG: hypothetical protein VXY34_10015 [Bdellovibrionota bacterium]|nr:hypothetical protein [Bdellovibrionota bacterium]MEC8625143.1 hypothetical protein [Bdellovibrionota bacterium]